MRLPGPGVVLVAGFPSPAVDRLAQDEEFLAILGRGGDVRFTAAAPASPEFLAELRSATALLTIARLSPADWEHVTSLRLISVPATGYQSFVDVAAAHAHDVDVAFVPSYGAESIAEHALALVLSLAKRIVPSDTSVRSGGWRLDAPSMQLAGGTAGVIGLGPIAAHMVVLLSALGMDVLVWTRSQDPARLAGTTARYASLEEIVDRSDVVSTHLALTPETAGLLDARLVNRLRPGAIVVNTARAELFAPGALESAVSAGRIRAGVDVFRHEPPAAEDRLLGLGDGVVLTPHAAFNTPQASRSVLLGAARNVAAFAVGDPTNLVPRETHS